MDPILLMVKLGLPPKNEQIARRITQIRTFGKILISWHTMDGKMYPTFQHIMWIGVTLTNFG
jgi:hypothetical protein